MSRNNYDYEYFYYSRQITKGLRKHRYESLPIRRIFCWAQFFLTPIEVFLTPNKI
jgi:hypothetical protein